jgi:hypothetical protein
LPSATGDGEFTCYTFNQGTTQVSGGYKTFCGYQGSETSGSGNNGPCDSGSLAASDSVTNVGTNPEYFAAFPSSNSEWGGTGLLCGMCVDVTYQGTTLLATIVDECATCSSSEHIDLSSNLARALGVGVGTAPGDVTGVTWKSAPCPVTGDIVVVWNNGDSSTGQAYFQNVVYPVTSVSGASQTSYAAWSPVKAGQSVTLTDALGQTVTATVPSSNNASLGVQFPATCN